MSYGKRGLLPITEVFFDMIEGNMKIELDGHDKLVNEIIDLLFL